MAPGVGSDVSACTFMGSQFPGPCGGRFADFAELLSGCLPAVTISAVEISGLCFLPDPYLELFCLCGPCLAQCGFRPPLPRVSYVGPCAWGPGCHRWGPGGKAAFGWGRTLPASAAAPWEPPLQGPPTALGLGPRGSGCFPCTVWSCFPARGRLGLISADFVLNVVRWRLVLRPGGSVLYVALWQDWKTSTPPPSSLPNIIIVSKCFSFNLK